MVVFITTYLQTINAIIIHRSHHSLNVWIPCKYH